MKLVSLLRAHVHTAQNVEMKNLNDFGGLVNSLPKRDKVFLVTSGGVSRVTL